MASSTGKAKFNTPAQWVVLLVVVAFMFLFRFIPAPQPITPYGMAVLGIFIGVVIGWCASGSQTMWASMLALFALATVMPTGSFGSAAAFLGGYAFILTFFSLFTVGALMGADIAEYLVYRLLTMKFLAGKPWRLVTMLMFGSYLVAILTNPMVVAIFLFILLQTLFDQVGYQKGEKTPTMMILCTAIEILMASILYPWAAPQLMALQALQTGTGIVIPNSSYLIFILLISALMMALMLGFMKLMKCDVSRMAHADLSFLHEKYGAGMTTYQKSVLIAMLVWVIGMVVIAFFPKSLGGISSVVTGQISFIGWAMLMTAVMLFIRVDNKPLIEPTAMAKSFPWDMLFMIGTGILLGNTLTAEDTGVTAWIGNILGPILGGVHEIVLYVAICLIALLLTNVLNNNAMIILLSTVVVTLNLQGFIQNPIVPIILVVVASELGFLTPAASIYGAFIHSQKHVTPASAYKYGSVMLAFCALFLLVIVIPLGVLIF